MIESVQRPPYRKVKGRYWRCVCSCGNERIMCSADIKRERWLSCGECSKNDFKIDGVNAIGILADGREFYFDAEDFNVVSGLTWCMNSNGYIVSWDRFNKRYVYLHRLLMGLTGDDAFVVDHINHVPYDNRKCNLRVCSHRQNILNSSIKKNNTSGVTGVQYNDDTHKWIAQITVHGKNLRLGSFDSFDAAVSERKSAEKVYFGEYAYKEVNADDQKSSSPM